MLLVYESCLVRLLETSRCVSRWSWNPNTLGITYSGIQHTLAVVLVALRVLIIAALRTYCGLILMWLYPFVENKCFVHFLQNTVERNRAFGQRGFRLQKHPEYSSLSGQEVGNIICSGGAPLRQLLSSMQSLGPCNACIRKGGCLRISSNRRVVVAFGSHYQWQTIIWKISSPPPFIVMLLMRPCQSQYLILFKKKLVGSAS